MMNLEFNFPAHLRKPGARTRVSQPDDSEPPSKQAATGTDFAAGHHTYAVRSPCKVISFQSARLGILTDFHGECRIAVFDFFGKGNGPPYPTTSWPRPLD